MNHTTNFILQSKNKHLEKFIYPESLYIITPSQIEKVIIKCIKHGDFSAVPRHHLKNETGGCSKCRADKTSESKIEKSKKQWEKDISEPERQELYDYSKFIFTKRKEPSIIICKKCNYEFNQSPNHHIDRKQGCDKCKKKQNGQNQCLSFSDFVKRCEEIHNNKYQYNSSNEKYESLNSIIPIFCNKCKHYFFQRAENHIRGNGCKECGKISSSVAKMSDTITFVNKAKEIGNNNKICDYSETIYKGWNVKVIIKCIPCNKSFEITPNNHLREKGCPYCHHHTSKPAREWLSLIEEKNQIKLQTFDCEEGEFKIPETKWKADGYHAETKTIYEFYGDYWHGNPCKYKPDFINEITKCTMGDLYIKTMEREKYIKKLGYNIISIWESEWKNK
jgi:hypothetical protein